MLARALRTSAILFALTFTTRMASAEPDWSVGVGVSLGGTRLVGLSGLGGLGGLALDARPMTYDVAMERRLSGPVWLRVRANAGYQDGGGPRSSTRQLGLATGVRWAFAELGPVEISALASARLSARELEAELSGAKGAFELSSLGVGASAGLSAEHAFDEAFSIRLSTEIVSMDWTRSRVANAESADPSASAAWFFDAAFELEPSLELRLRF